MDHIEGCVDPFLQVGQHFMMLVINVQKQIEVFGQWQRVDLMLRIGTQVSTDESAGDDCCDEADEEML